MYVSTKRLNARVVSVMRRVLWLNVGLAMALYAQLVVGQDQPGGDYPNLLNSGADSGQLQRAQQPQWPPQPGANQQYPGLAPQGAGDARSEIGDAVEDGILFGDQISGRTGEALGVLFRAGVSTGPSIGRDQSIVPLEIMPYAFNNNAMVFGSLRGFRGTNYGFGMNAGGGIRYFSERWDRILGANVFYDYDNSSGGQFSQMGFGAELLGQFWDSRFNMYIPNSTTQRLLSTSLVAGSQAFVGHQMTYSELFTYGNALRGLDLEFGVPVPGRLATRHDLKIFGGWYDYSSASVPEFSGWKGRAQANVMQNFGVQLEVMNDHIFHTNVVFSATWTHGGFRQPEGQKRTQFDRMTEQVRRNYNVIIAKIPQTQTGLVAINPINNNPYFFEHVASYAPIAGADGTVNHPWQTVAQATTALNNILPTPQQQAGNFIYVHANSVYNQAPDNTVTLIPSVRILGEGNGVVHVVNVPNLGAIPLPRATNLPNRPIFELQTGNAVTLVSGTAGAPSEFSGFQIGDPTNKASGPTGIGILGNGIANVVVNQTDVNFAQGGGIGLDNTTGRVALLGDVINNLGNPTPNSVALDVENSASGSNIVFGVEPVTLKASTINNVGGAALVAQNTANASILNLTGSTINDGTLAGGANTPAETAGGVYLKNINGIATLGSLQLVNTIPVTVNTLVGPLVTNGNAIDIEGTNASANTVQSGFGQITFLGGIAIDNPQGDAIYINALQGVGTTVGNVRFDLPNPVNNVLSPGIQITSRNAGGIVVQNNVFGNVAFFEPVSIGANAAGTGLSAAIAYENNTGNLTFQSILPSSSQNEITISGGTGNGIQIGGLTTSNLSGTNKGQDIIGPNTGAFHVVGSTNISNVAGTAGTPNTGISILVGDTQFPALLLPAANPNAVAPFNLANNPAAANNGTVLFENVSINNRGAQGIAVWGVENLVAFQGTTTVSNTTNSLKPAVDLERNLVNNIPAGQVGAAAGNMTFQTLDINQAQGPTVAPITSGAGLNVISNESSVTITQLNINQNSLLGNGVALYAEDNGLATRVILPANNPADPAGVNNPPAYAPTFTSATPTPQLGLGISNGNIFSQGGAAVIIKDSVIGVTLTSVSSTNSSTEGINLQNNIGVGSEVQSNGTTVHPIIFSITGILNNVATGGAIQGATNEGVFLLNTEAVQLKNMTISGNGATNVATATGASGVYAQTPQLNMINDQVVGNGWYGINFFAVAVPPTLGNQTLPTTSPFFELVGSTVTGNLSTEEVLYTAAGQGIGTYTAVIGSSSFGVNTITHNVNPLVVLTGFPPENPNNIIINEDGVYIQSLGSAIGSTLNLTAVNTTYNVANPTNVILAGALADLQVDWNGVVKTGVIESNTFNFGANTGEGVLVNLQSSTNSANFRIAGNKFNSPAGTGTTGIDITTNGGPTNLQIGALDNLLGNVMTFVQPNNGVIVAGGARVDDEAMRFNLGANAVENIFTNTITMTGTNIEGIQFTTVTGPNTTTINNNLITLTDPVNPGFVGPNAYGIRILNITAGTMRLFGTLDNIITNNGFTGSVLPYFFSPGLANGNTPGTLGSIVVNGINVP